MSLLDKSIKRRDFLRVSAGAAAAAATLSAASPKAAHAAEGKGYDEVAHDAQVVGEEGEWVPIHCHQNCNQMCLNMG